MKVSCYSTVYQDAEARFWAKVEKTGSCWLWNGQRAHDGYGIFSVGVPPKRYGTGAHRFAWEYTHGEIPEGMQIDHLCRVRDCVNPDHLEVVTPKVNSERARSFIPPVEECIRGHAYTEANTYVARDGWRSCKTCRRDASRRSRLNRADRVERLGAPPEAEMDGA